MKEKAIKTKFVPLLAAGALLLSGCSIYDFISSKDSSSSNSTSTPDTSVPDASGSCHLAGDVTPFSYRDLQDSSFLDAVPSEGDIEILVLPIQLKGYSFSSSFSTDLDNALNGDGETDTGYWESLSSYYKKSSFGKLNLHFTIGSVYESTYTPSSLFSYNTQNSKNSAAPASDMMLEKAVANYKSNNGSSSTKAFDSDSDGQIDGTIMVYSCPDMSSSQTIYNIDSDGEVFWAYTYWDYQNAYYNKKAASPIGNTYFWMSYDFLYEAVNSPKVDSHTLIHEFGHMLGLDDYYSSSESPDPNYNPDGGWVMMDENILDHDAYSKMALGWTEPYVVDGDCTISIKPSESSGQCILIPTSSWNGTAFDEYLLLELYSPTGLNYLDSHTAYSNREKHFTTYGVKMYHVDARLMRASNQSSEYKYEYISATSLDSDNYAYMVGATNCGKNYNPASTDFDLLRMISADGTNLFKNGQLADEDSLFQTGDSFDSHTYASYFPKTSGTLLNKKASYNNGSVISYSISFDTVSDSYATISFSQN